MSFWCKKPNRPGPCISGGSSGFICNVHSGMCFCLSRLIIPSMKSMCFCPYFGMVWFEAAKKCLWKTVLKQSLVFNICILCPLNEYFQKLGDADIESTKNVSESNCSPGQDYSAFPHTIVTATISIYTFSLTKPIFFLLGCIRSLILSYIILIFFWEWIVCFVRESSIMNVFCTCILYKTHASEFAYLKLTFQVFFWQKKS